MDRIDLQLEIDPVPINELASNEVKVETSAEIKKRVVAVRKIQYLRQQKTNAFLNEKELKNKDGFQDYLLAAERLLLDCKEYGTRIFSTMARIAFIANTILKSVKTQEKIKQEDVESFLNLNLPKLGRKHP